MVYSRSQIQTFVENEGLVFLGIVDVQGDSLAYERYENWLANAKHAGMKYLEEHKHLRRDPTQLLAGAKSVVVVGFDYRHKEENLDAPRIAKYAHLKDYHRILRAKGEKIFAAMSANLSDGHLHAARVLVDSAPILERAMSAKTASGFIGKNTCFIAPKVGSFLLLSEIITTLDLPKDNAVQVDPHNRGDMGGCGSCQRCQKHCPTGALDEAYRLDANLCLAYWSIENRDAVPLKFWPWFKTYFFGCDICQNVCPYNRVESSEKSQKSFTAFQIHSFPSLEEIVFMDQAFYERHFGGTALTRAKRDGLRRNALIALVAAGAPGLARVLARARNDAAELIRKTAAQAEEYLNLNG